MWSDTRQYGAYRPFIIMISRRGEEKELTIYLSCLRQTCETPDPCLTRGSGRSVPSCTFGIRASGSYQRHSRYVILSLISEPMWANCSCRNGKENINTPITARTAVVWPIGAKRTHTANRLARIAVLRIFITRAGVNGAIGGGGRWRWRWVLA